jgi:hypothetical protein
MCGLGRYAAPGLALLGLVLSATACTGFQSRDGERALFRELPGAEFVLHHDVTIAPRRVRIHFQDGAAAHAYSEFSPHCELVAPVLRAEPWQVPAGRYRIGRVTGRIHYVRGARAPLRLAAMAGAPLMVSDSDSEWYMRAYHMTLHAPGQADGLRLVCGGAYNFPFYAKFPTLEEMQVAFGTHATLVLVGSASPREGY